MTPFKVPTRDEVTENNQQIFDQLTEKVGFVPNLYATYAYSKTALGDYLTLQNRKTSLTAKEKEIINLVVSEVNDCKYCKAAHTAIGKMNGFSEKQILEIRGGTVSFDSKYDALAKFIKDTTINRGKPSAESVTNLLASGYNKENLIDAIIVIGDKIISNYLHGITQIPVDFPEAVELENINA